MGGWARDIRQACRALASAPGITIVMLTVLTAGIGVNAAMFSVLSALSFRDLPVAHPEQLILIAATAKSSQTYRPIYSSSWIGLQDRVRTLSALAGYSAGGLLTAETSAGFSTVRIEGASGEYFSLLGATPFLGRFIAPSEAPRFVEPLPVAVLSYLFWKHRFGGRPDAIGQSIKVNNVPLTVIGVTPQGFGGLQVDREFDVSVPIGLIRKLVGNTNAPVRANYLVGRLRSGASMNDADAELQAMWPIVRRETLPAALAPAERMEFSNTSLNLRSGRRGISALRTQFAKPAGLLWGLTLVLLAIGCVM